MNYRKIVCGGVWALCMGTALGASTWHVDANSGMDGPGRGSAAAPFATIQAAVDAASEGDTISVAEGVYATGSRDGLYWSYVYKAALEKYPDFMTSGYNQTRVLVDKRLDFVASGTRDRTVIQGAWGDPLDEWPLWRDFYRTNGVACVVLQTAAKGTTFTGFTFQDGYMHQSALVGGGSQAYASGGISFDDAVVDGATPGENFTVTDCAFINCFGRGGGAMRGGVAIRSRFLRNVSIQEGSAIKRTKAFNCLFTGNSRLGAGWATRDCALVNCTVFNQKSRGATQTLSTCPAGYGEAYNVVSYANAANESITNGVWRNCVCRGAVSDGGDVADVLFLSSDTYTNLCVNPYFGDYRPVADGFLDGTGDPAWLQFDWIPAKERLLNFDGSARAAEDPVPIGILLPAEEVTSGVLYWNSSGLTLNGQLAAKYPAFVQGRAGTQIAIGIAPDNANVIGLGGLGDPAFGNRDTIWQLLPPKHNDDGSPMPMYSIGPFRATYNLWVDCSYTGGDSDGSQEKPFTTLKDAVDALAGTSSEWTRVWVAKGRYDTGEVPARDAGGVKARVVIPDNHPVVFIATEGPAKTFILGKASAETPQGCGTDAVRCIYSQGVAAFCGFTIADGHCYGWQDKQDAVYAAGAAYCKDARTQFFDCTFTGCSGNFAVGYNGCYHRCTFTNNVYMRRGLISAESSSGTVLASCLFADNSRQSGESYTDIFQFAYAFNTSFCETNCANVNVVHINCRLANCAIRTKGKLPAVNDGGAFVGCVGRADTSNDLDEERNVRADPKFIRISHGDYHLSATSPGVGTGTLATYRSITASSYVKYLRGDLTNAPLVADDGTFNVGCYAEVRTQPKALFVSPTGDDNNDGHTEATPLQTLQVACDRAGSAAGYPDPVNEVVALPGVYEQGQRGYTGRVATSYTSPYGDPRIQARVVVPAGVTLRSRDGAASTVIKGKRGTVNANDWGCGDDALRCAFLETGATVRGFTLTEGHSCTNMDSYYDDKLGGGVLGRNLRNCFVEDCEIANCSAPCGGGGAFATFRRCVVHDNYAPQYGSFFRHGQAFDCLVYDNRGNQVFDVFYDIVGCTFYANLTSSGTGLTTIFRNGYSRIVNTLFVDSTKDTFPGCGKLSISNCVAPSIFNTSSLASVHNVNRDYTRAQLNAFYVNGRAVTSAAPGVDAGLSGEEQTEADVDGQPRIQNGAIDIGATEYNWLSDYAAALGRKVTVAEAGAGVVETDGRVTLRDGAKLRANWATKGIHEIPVTLTGSGTFEVWVNGAQVGVLTASGVVRFRSADTANDIVLKYTGEGLATLDDGFVHATGMALNFR